MDIVYRDSIKIVIHLGVYDEKGLTHFAGYPLNVSHVKCESRESQQYLARTPRREGSGKAITMTMGNARKIP